MTTLLLLNTFAVRCSPMMTAAHLCENIQQVAETRTHQTDTSDLATVVE